MSPIFWTFWQAPDPRRLKKPDCTNKKINYIEQKTRRRYKAGTVPKYFFSPLCLGIAARAVCCCCCCCRWSGCSRQRYAFLQRAAMSTGSPPVLGDSFSHEPRRSPRLQDRGVAGCEVITTTADTGGVVNTTTAATGRVITDTAAAGRAVATMAIAGCGVRIAATRIPPVGATGPRGRGVKYNKDEIESFLDTMAEFLPIGPQEWEDVTEVHNDRFPLNTRDSQSLR